jgi:S-ribosylhomocysteine lyase
MEQIRSFQIDHTKLQRGIYVSRVDTLRPSGDAHVTTFDLRLCRPYFDEPLDVCAIHTIEHLGAVFLRTKSYFANDIVYFGPMGCRTGFYLIVDGELSVEDISGTVREMFAWMATFDGPIPGATQKECGNADSHNITEARRIAHQYFNEVLFSLDETNTIYPIIKEQ